MKPIDEVLSENSYIILFDGLCGFCDSCVDFVIRNDSRRIFKFVSLQSELGQKLLRHFSLPTDSLDSAVLIENGSAYLFSTASLRIARRLRLGWSLFFILILVPKPWRDWAYRYFANHRYQWFGRSNSCRIPTPAIRDRFIE